MTATKNGSGKRSPKGKPKTTDVLTFGKVKHRDAPTELPVRVEPGVSPSPTGYTTDGAGGHLRALAPIPPEARENPLKWAESQAESLAPDSIKELEWALKFGSDAARRQTALDLLAMKGLTTKPKDTAPPQPPMTVNFMGPVSQTGAPVLPFMNAPIKQIEATAVRVEPSVKAPNTVPLDGTNAAVTMPITAPTTKPE